MGGWQDFKDLVRQGFHLFWNLGSLAAEQVYQVIVAYFLRVKKWSVRFLIWAAVPFPLVFFLLLFHAPLGPVYGAYVAWLAVLLAAELLLITPLVLVWRRLRKLFPAIAQDLEEWLEFIKTVLVNGMNLAIFVALYPVWRSSFGTLLSLFTLASWLMLPACSNGTFRRRIYPVLRAIQLVVSFVLAILSLAFPAEIKQLSWATQTKIAGAITIREHDITAGWKTNVWFANASGKPLVWYVYSEADGYRLFDAPGFDRVTGKHLTPVETNTIGRILEDYGRREKQAAAVQAARQKEQEEAEKKRAVERELAAQKQATEKQLVEAKEQEQKQERERLAAEAVAKQRAEAEEKARADAEARHRETLARYLITPGTTNRAELTVAVRNPQGGLDSGFSSAVATELSNAGLKADPPVFREAFAADGLLESVFSGDSSKVAGLELSNRVLNVFVALESAKYSTNSELEGLVTSQIAFHARITSTATGQVSDDFKVTAAGVGFDTDRAFANAQERLLDQLRKRHWTVK